MNWQQRLKARGLAAVDRCRDMARIFEDTVLNSPMTEAGEEALSVRWVQAKAYEGQCQCVKCEGQPFRLLHDQAQGLREFLRTESGFFSIKVGGGKTGLCMMIASAWLEQHPTSKVVLLLPSSVFKQFWDRDLPWARAHLAITNPWYGLGGKSRQQRMALAKSGRPGCYVIPYSLMSTEDTIEVLDLIDPDLIELDEAQQIMGTSARSKRFWAFVTRKTPKGVGMSGTLTRKSPMDYHKLIRFCLRDNSPLPRPIAKALGWAQLLMSGADKPTAKDRLIVQPALDWAREVDPEHAADYTFTTQGYRAAYRLRLHTTPGFVRSGDKALGVSLEIANLPTYAPSKKLTDMIDKVNDKWVSPSGDALSYGIEIHNVLRELSAGFYYRRYWDEEHPLVEQAKDHWEKGNDYSKELRQFFGSTNFPIPGLDTPMVVGKHHHQDGPMPGWEHLYGLWSEWKEAWSDGLPERLSEPVRVDPYKVNQAVAWAAKHRRGIIWVHHRALMEWIAEGLAYAGAQFMVKGAGATWLERDGSEDGIVVASIAAHGTGKNLQAFRNQLLVQWPRPAPQAEQLLGRTHRTGQKADRLVVHTNRTLPFDHEQLAATLADTVYMNQTMGGQPKLLIADWDPVPAAFPVDYLRKKGYALEENEA